MSLGLVPTAPFYPNFHYLAQKEAPAPQVFPPIPNPSVAQGPLQVHPNIPWVFSLVFYTQNHNFLPSFLPVFHLFSCFPFITLSTKLLGSCGIQDVSSPAGKSSFPILLPQIPSCFPSGDSSDRAGGDTGAALFDDPNAQKKPRKRTQTPKKEPQTPHRSQREKPFFFFRVFLRFFSCISKAGTGPAREVTPLGCPWGQGSAGLG